MTKSDYKAVKQFLRLMHAAAPCETAVAVRKMVRLFEQIPERAPRPANRPLLWTPEWQRALVIFVERSVYRDVWKAVLHGGSTEKRAIQEMRKTALKESLTRQFPFHSRTLDAAKTQLSNAKKKLLAIDRPGESLTWIHTALELETTYEIFKHLAADFPNEIIVIRPEYRAMPEWIWEKLAKDGRLLMPDIPKIN